MRSLLLVLAVSLFLFAGAARAASPTFQRLGTAVGTDPHAVAVGDFNGDGRQDLAVAKELSGTVSILLGNGNGTFTQAPGSPITVGTDPTSVAVGDFNGDGIPDLAVANQGSGTVSILLGNGNGTFTQAPASPITVGKDPISVAVGDFNGDGIPDLAVTNFGGSSVSVLLGNGDGTFTQAPGSPITVGKDPISVAVGDFNGDGIPDLAVTNFGGSSVSVLLGNGDGTFTQATGSPIAVGSGPFSVGVGDFNGDGKQDLAVAAQFSNSVSVLLGNGDGTFTQASGPPITVGSTPISVAVGDFTGDGRQDLAVANFVSASVTVLVNTSQPAVSLSPSSVTFPAAQVGSVSGSHTVTVTNTGAAGAVRLGGGGGGPGRRRVQGLGRRLLGDDRRRRRFVHYRHAVLAGRVGPGQRAAADLHQCGVALLAGGAVRRGSAAPNAGVVVRDRPRSRVRDREQRQRATR
jgi:hypothetical protein